MRSARRPTRRSMPRRRSTATLIRANPMDPASPDHGLRSVHRDADADRRRQDLHLQDPAGRQVPRRLAADRRRTSRRRWNKIIFPPEGVVSPRQSNFLMVDKVEATDPHDRRLSPQIRHRRVHPGARRPLCLDLQQGEARQGHPLVREEHPRLRPLQVRQLRDRPVDQGRAQPGLLPPRPALSRRLQGHLRRQAGDPRRGDPQRPRRDRVPRLSADRARRADRRRSATRSRCRQATGIAAG